MRNKRLISALLAGVILLTSVLGTAADPSAKKANWPSGPSKSSLSCDSAIVMELSTGLILYQKNIHKQHYPASITKIMTAMLALEHSSLSETVTFSEEAVYGIEAGSSTICSEVDEKMTMEECLYAIMLESANEVCLAVGEHISGTSKKFVKLMNERVKSLGLEDTHFNNPNGLPDPDHYTTAYDMAVIAREAMKNTNFQKFVGTRSYTNSPTNKHSEERTWLNHHEMISGRKYPKYIYKYCIGGKTGYTNIARSTLVTYAEKDGMQLVSVIMYADGPTAGEPNEYTDSTSLLNFGFEKYKKYTLDGESTDVNSSLFNNYGSYFNTEKSPIRLSSQSTVILPKGVKLSKAKQTITYNDNVTLTSGENIIGQVTYTYGGKTVGSTDIIYDVSESTQLDEASRKVVSAKIEEIENANEKAAKKSQFWPKIKEGFSNFLGQIGQLFTKQLSLALASLLLILALIGLIIYGLISSRERKARIGTGGYRSKAGRRNYMKRMKAQKAAGSVKSKRRNHSKHYAKNQPSSNKSSSRKRNKGINYSKRHKNTRESFGRNFFDFFDQ